jgi:hypothetical protein
MAISSALGSSALLPAGLGFRNELINGDFGINQRAFTSTTTDGAYGFDRWRMFASDGTTTYSAQTFTAGNAIPNQEPKNFARLVTSGQTSSTAVSFGTSINIGTGEVTLSLTANATANLIAGRYVYDCELTDASGTVSRILEGIVTINPQVTR